MTAMTDNLNVESNNPLITPQMLKAELPLAGSALDTVQQARQTIFNILDRKDHRLFVVVGPCSIHDPQAAMDYAHRLKELAPKLADTLFLVMRVYFDQGYQRWSGAPAAPCPVQTPPAAARL